jgi:hypothetical protein
MGIFFVHKSDFCGFQIAAKVMVVGAQHMPQPAI